MEHHANIVPWIRVARREGLILRHIPVTAGGELDLDTLPGLINDRTRVVALTHVSNVLGTVNPVREIAERYRAPDFEVYLAGSPVVTHFLKNTMMRDMRKFMGLAFATIALLLFIFPDILKNYFRFHFQRTG